MPSRDTVHERGVWGEQIARHYLENKGYRFIAANWSCKTGEIDLIMQDGPTRVFVEVRLRSSQSLYGSGFDTVTYKKQRKLINTVSFYQQQQNYWDDIRFDVISIADDPRQSKISHITHAFEAF